MLVLHHRDQKRFTLETPAGEAEITYQIRDDGALDLVHTFVPPAARGGLIASDLVRGAVDHATAHDLKLVATCPYVRSWLVRHPEAKGVFVGG